MQRRNYEEEIAAAIQSYLRAYPQAMDTLEGIAGWWLRLQQLRADPITLARVLQQLVERGVLEKIGTGKYARYCLQRRDASP